LRRRVGLAEGGSSLAPPVQGALPTGVYKDTNSSRQPQTASLVINRLKNKQI